MPTASSHTPVTVSRLPMTTASEMKRQGWRGVLATMRREGHLVITNHNVPEAVILPPEQYDKLVNDAQKALSAPDPKLEALRLRFRERMKALHTEDAEDRLSEMMSLPLKLNGTVIAGETY